MGSLEPAGAQKPGLTGMHPSTPVRPVALAKCPLSQASGEVLAAVQYEPEGQVVHPDAPPDGWKLPAEHSTHALSPVVLVKPPGAHAIGVTERARQ